MEIKNAEGRNPESMKPLESVNNCSISMSFSVSIFMFKNLTLSNFSIIYWLHKYFLQGLQHNKKKKKKGMLYLSRAFSSKFFLFVFFEGFVSLVWGLVAGVFFSLTSAGRAWSCSIDTSRNLCNWEAQFCGSSSVPCWKILCCVHYY